MKKLLFVLLLVVVGFGFYRGWLALSKDQGDNGNNVINIRVDTDKAKEDADMVKDKTKVLTDRAKDASK